MIPSILIGFWIISTLALLELGINDIYQAIAIPLLVITLVFIASIMDRK